MLFIDKPLEHRNNVIKTFQKISSKTESDILNVINLRTIGVLQYSATLTLLQRHDQLKDNSQTKTTPRWLDFQQQKCLHNQM